MRRAARLGIYIGGGVIAGLLLGSLTVLLLSHTQFGRDRMRAYVARKLAHAIHGEFHLGRLTGPGLLGGVMVHDLAIADAQGRPFVAVDSARVAYDWTTLLKGEVVLDHVTLYQPRLYMEQLPGDTLWNYEHIFADTTGAKGGGPGPLILLQDVTIHGGLAEIHIPRAPTSGSTRPDTSVWRFEEVPGGFAQVLRFDSIQAHLDRVLWQSPVEEGKLFRVNSLAMRAGIMQRPLRVADMAGTVTMRDSVVSFDFPTVAWPAGSRASALGRIISTGDQHLYDFRLDARKLDFRDLQWLHPGFPAEGGGSLVLRVQSQEPKGILFQAQDARLVAPGTRLAGTFGIVVGDTLYFTNVDLKASPLDLQLLKAMVPPNLPLDGLLVGTVEVKGPLSYLETTGDLHYTPPEGGVASGLSWRGTLDMRYGPAARDLEAQLDDFDLGLLARWRPGLDLRGTVRGEIRASGGRRDLHFTGDLVHAVPGAPLSTLSGGGTLARQDSTDLLDLRLTAHPFSLDALGRAYPGLQGLTGSARGSIHIHGPLGALAGEADLETTGGTLSARGRLARADSLPELIASGALSSFTLGRVYRGLPAVRLTGRFGLDITGRQWANLTGPVRVVLDSADAGGVQLRSLLLRGRVERGLARIDTLVARLEGGVVTVEGEFGLSASRHGTLRVQGNSASLTPFQTAIFGDTLFDPLAPPRLAGTAHVEGSLSGSLHGFRLDGNATLSGLVLGNQQAQHFALQAQGRDIAGTAPTFTLGAAGDSLLVLGHSTDSARVQLAYGKHATTFDVGAWRAGDSLLGTAGTLRDVGAADRILRVAHFHLGTGDGAWRLPDTALIRLQPGSARMDSLVLRQVHGPGRVVAAGRLGWLTSASEATASTPSPPGTAAIGVPAGEDAEDSPPLDFRLALEATPLTDFMHLVAADPPLVGTVAGRLRLTGTARHPVADGEMAVRDLHYGELTLQRLSSQFTYAARTVNLRLEGRHGDQRVLTGDGSIPLDLTLGAVSHRRLDSPLEYSFKLDSLPAGFLAGLVGGFSNITGRLDGAVLARGTTANPKLGGSVTVTAGAATWDGTNVRYHDLSGSLKASGDRVVDVDLTLGTGEASGHPATPLHPSSAVSGLPPGMAHITGSIDFQNPGDPALDLGVAADHVLAARRRDVDLTASGSLQVAGRYRAPVVSGRLTADGGALYLDELYRQYQIIGLESPLLFDVVDTSLVSVRRVLPPTQNPFLKNLAVQDATVVVEPGSWLRSRDMNVEVSGNLAVAFDRRKEDLRMTGILTVLRGTYTLYYPPFARRFEVRDGSVEFPGTPGIDPNMAITAAYRARTTQGDPLDITATVSGTLQNPRVRLSSDAQPPISESDLASYLFFGAPTYALGTAGGLRGATSGTNQVAGFGFQTLAPSAFGYVASGLQTLGQNFGLVDYVGLTTAEAVPRTQSRSDLGSIFAGTEVELGRYITPSTFLAVTKRLDTPASDAGVRLEWQFHPTFRAEFFAEDRFARAPSFGFAESAEFRKVYGVFLFRQWSY